MQVRYIDDTIPRSDAKNGKPTEVTVGKVYIVAEELATKYSIINDEYKIARYSKERFEIVDDSPVLPLRDAFNTLTKEMRMKLKKSDKFLVSNNMV